MPDDPLSDEELLERARSEEDARRAGQWINLLFERYYSRVARWCLRLSGDRDSALDLAQEVFFKAYRNLDSFRSESRFSTWLYVITRNHCFNYVKTIERRPRQVGDEALNQVVDELAESAVDNLGRDETQQRVRELLANLDETERQVMVLHYAEELPLRAVTRLLRLENRSGAKAYIVSARRKLKRAVVRWKSLPSG